MQFNCSIVLNSLQPHELPCPRRLCPSLSPSLLKLMSIELVMPFNHLILCHLLLVLPLIFPSIRVYSNESALHIRWPNYGNLSFSISPSNEYLGLISFRINWFDLLAVHNLKALVLWCLAFFMVQLSHPYMTTGKTIASNIRTFVGKVMSLLFTAWVCHSINFYT